MTAKNNNKLFFSGLQGFSTPEACLAAVQKNGWALQHVPKELVTPELCLAAVKKSATAIQFVPYELMTEELCLVAVKNHDWALYYMPEEFKTPEVFRIAEQTKDFFRSSLREECLLEVQEKRQKIIAAGERGRGLFTTWYSLPNDPGYSEADPLYHLLFTASLSRKYDDIYYLYSLDTYDGEAWHIALEQAKLEYNKEIDIYERSIELLKEGVTITPYFVPQKSKLALVEIVGVVDVYSFDSDGIAKAINMFLDGGEVEYIGEPLIHKATEGFLNFLEREEELEEG